MAVRWLRLQSSFTHMVTSVKARELLARFAVGGLIRVTVVAVRLIRVTVVAVRLTGMIVVAMIVPRVVVVFHADRGKLFSLLFRGQRRPFFGTAFTAETDRLTVVLGDQLGSRFPSHDRTLRVGELDRGSRRRRGTCVGISRRLGSAAGEGNSKQQGN
jgi:hypothetical protein